MGLEIMNDIRKVFGYRHLGIFFRPIIEVLDEGVLFKNKKILWEEIKMVEFEEGWLPWFGSLGGMLLHTKDGKVARVASSLVQKECLKEVSLGEPTFAYNELMNEMKDKVHCVNSSVFRIEILLWFVIIFGVSLELVFVLLELLVGEMNRTLLLLIPSLIVVAAVLLIWRKRL